MEMASFCLKIRHVFGFTSSESIEGGTGLETVLFIQLKLGQKKNTGHVTKVGAHICNANGRKHINKLWRRGFVCRRGFVRFCR